MDNALIIKIITYCIGGIGSLLTIIASIKKDSFPKKNIMLISILLMLVYAAINLDVPLMVFLLVNAIVLCLKFFRKKNFKDIKLMEVEYESSYLQEFLNMYKKEIYLFFPFYRQTPDQKFFIIMRNLNFAGLLVVSKIAKTLVIEMDFVKKYYRDSTVGNYIYRENLGYFKKLGAERLVAKSYNIHHSKYLRNMGFEQATFNNEIYYVKNIN